MNTGMKITLRLLGNLRQYLQAGREFSDLELDVAEGSTPADISARLGIPQGESLMFVVNDVRLTPDQLAQATLKAGDRLVISPAIKGG